MKKARFNTLILLSAFILNLLPASPALAQEGPRDKRQPPAQVAIQIVLTAIALKLVESRVIPKD